MKIALQTPTVNAVEEASKELGPLGPPMVKLFRALLAEQAPTNEAPSPIVDMAGICAHFGVSAPTVRKWISAGMPCMQCGEVRRFNKVTVAQWLTEQAKGGAQ